jgi:hypothetical protein
MVYNAEQVTSAALVIQSARGVVQCLSLSDTQTRREFLLSARDAGGHVSVTELSSGAHSDAGKLVAVAAQLCPTLSQKLEIRMHGDDDEGGERATLLQRASGRSIKLAARDGYWCSLVTMPLCEPQLRKRLLPKTHKALFLLSLR